MGGTLGHAELARHVEIPEGSLDLVAVGIAQKAAVVRNSLRNPRIGLAIVRGTGSETRGVKGIDLGL